MGAYVKLDVFVISVWKSPHLALYLLASELSNLLEGSIEPVSSYLRIYDLGLLHGPCCINWHFGRYLANDLLADLFQS